MTYVDDVMAPGRRGRSPGQPPALTYADDVISMTKDGAKKIDAQKAFYFQLGDRPVELFRRQDRQRRTKNKTSHSYASFHKQGQAMHSN